MNIFELNTMIELTEKQYGADDELVKYYKAKREEMKKQIIHMMVAGFKEEAEKACKEMFPNLSSREINYLLSIATDF